MATLKQRLHRKDHTGEYNTIHLETTADLVLVDSNGTTALDIISTIDDKINNISIPVPPHTSGEVITWENYEWLVVHVGRKLMFMITNDILSTTRFDTNNTNKYAGSTIAKLAQTFENSLSSNAKSRLATVTTYGVEAKVFIPTFQQCGLTFANNQENATGFEWFTNNNRRLAKYNGVYTEWWTSTPTILDDEPANVAIDTDHGGSSGNRYYSATNHKYCGFRPCVAYIL